MLPRSWCVDYTPRGACSLVAKYSEGMEEDASLMSGIKDRHLTEEGRERGREVDMLAVIVQFYISRPSPPSLPPSPTSSLSAPLPPSLPLFQTETCGSKEINASSFLVCRLYTERACSLVGQYLEGMEKDAPLMSGIKDRHCAIDDAIYY